LSEGWVWLREAKMDLRFSDLRLKRDDDEETKSLNQVQGDNYAIKISEISGIRGFCQTENLIKSG